jgi:heme-degrading monooxygenase HmoA
VSGGAKDNINITMCEMCQVAGGPRGWTTGDSHGDRDCADRREAGSEREFEQGAEKARPIFGQAKGIRRLGLLRGIEKPQRYRLIIEWETLENHTVDFFGSDNWKAWRALVGHCFAGGPQVDRSNTVLPLA